MAASASKTVELNERQAVGSEEVWFGLGWVGWWGLFVCLCFCLSFFLFLFVVFCFCFLRLYWAVVLFFGSVLTIFFGDALDAEK